MGPEFLGIFLVFSFRSFSKKKFILVMPLDLIDKSIHNCIIVVTATFHFNCHKQRWYHETDFRLIRSTPKSTCYLPDDFLWKPKEQSHIFLFGDFFLLICICLVLLKILGDEQSCVLQADKEDLVSYFVKAVNLFLKNGE